MKNNCDLIAGKSEKLDAFLKKIKSLPPTPTVLVRLMEEFRKPDVDPDVIVDLLQRDPAPAAEVLRRCNSSFFGSGAAVDDLHEAIFQLGFYELYQIVVFLFGLRAISLNKEIPGFSIEELRFHSSISAIAAGSLAKVLQKNEATAFTAGLLHDVGKLVLVLGDSTSYMAVIEETKSKGLRLSQLEEKTFGFDHGEVGAYLLSSWGVPEEVVLPVQEHTKAVGKDARHADTLIVIAASALADHVESGSLHSFHSSEPARLLKEELELSEDQIAEWESAVWAKVTQMAALESRS